MNFKIKVLTNLLISVILTLVSVYLIVSRLSVGSIIDTLFKLDGNVLLFGIFIYLLVYLLRAIRFYIIFNRQISLGGFFSIVCLHNFFTNILPGRLGEISYIYLVGSNKKGSYSQGISSLIIARILDMLVISLMLSYTLIFLLNKASTTFHILYYAIGMFVICIVLLLLLIKCNVGETLKKFDTIHPTRILNFFSNILIDLKNQNKRNLTLNILLTILIWHLSFYFNFYLLTSFGMEIGLIATTFASILSLMTTIIPLQPIAGIGFIEGGWVAGFKILGISGESAISSSFAIHAIILLYSVSLGVLYLFKSIPSLHAKAR